MLNAKLSQGIVTLRPFVPSKDFELSKRFYADIGFDVSPLGDSVANVQIGDFAFLLQNYFVDQWAANFMMHLLVTNLDDWWTHISGLDLSDRYGVRTVPPEMQSWGLKVAYVDDPSGVLWRIAEDGP